MKALLLVDLQYDFLEGGALAVKDANAVIPVANQLARDFRMVLATQDWHPADHGSFASQHSNKEPFEMIDLYGLDQTLWPNHCVQNSRGAAFSDELEVRFDAVFQKGQDKTVDSYSGFFDNGNRHDTGLNAYLKDHGVKQLHIMGLATDYCVNFTAQDAIASGFDTYLHLAGCRGVELNPGDCERVLAHLQAIGVHLID